MPHEQRVTLDKIVTAYRETGSIWKAAKVLGICGQSVWERLKAIDYPVQHAKWTREEKLELTALVGHCTLSDIASRLGRPYYGVAIMASRMGISSRAGSRMNRKPPRGSGLTKKRTKAVVHDLRNFAGSIRQFCRTHGLDIETLARAIQTHEPEYWREQSAARGFEAKTCPNCDQAYYPMTEKQSTCSRRCGDQHRRNTQYFGGKRNNTVGLSDGQCQLCLKKKPKGLSSHHVLGKENDPDNEILIALCQGCHQLVGRLAAMAMSESEEAWQRLIELVLARRISTHPGKPSGTYVCVDIEYLSEQDCIDMGMLPEPESKGDDDAE